MFRSVKNWLTLLIVALVALAMLVAWVYVVPPLRGRLVEQKLADARGNARLISETLSHRGLPATTRATGQLVDADAERRSTAHVSSISTRFDGRVIVYTRNLVPRRGLRQPGRSPTSPTTRCSSRRSVPAGSRRGR